MVSDSASGTSPAGSPQNPPTLAVYPKRTNLYLKLVLAGIIIIISLQGYIILSSQSWTLIPTGTSFTVDSQSSHAVEFSLSHSSIISGTIDSTNGVLLYLVNSWEYNNATLKDNPTYHIFVGGTVFGVFMLSYGLPQGTYWIIFTNNSPQNTTVKIIQSINLSPY